MFKVVSPAIAKMAVAPLAAAILSACAVGPNYHAPETKAAAAFDNAEAATYSTDGVGTDAAQTNVAEFWTGFHDATLDTLVNDALVANHDLRIAITRVREARALRRDSAFDLGPSIDAGGGYTKTRTAAVATLPGAARESEYYDAGFDAVWELDFFGRVRRGLEASNAELGAAEASARDAQVIVTAEVTRTYFELRGEQQQLDVARRNVANQKETLDLAQVRLDAGSGTEFDTARAQAQLSTTSGTIAPLEAAVARSIHRLSVLVGKEPGALRATLTPPQTLPALPGIVPVGDPAGLLRRRPDIRIAERELAADTARIGVAVADLFPRVTFTGNAGYVATERSGLGDSGSDTFTLAPGISWAIFDLGHVQARIGAARWRKEGSVLRYEQTVLKALEETENSLVTHARARERLVHDEEAVRASNTAAGLARVRYENGASDFLAVLDAERIQLQSEDQLARSRTEAATSLIAVYKSLGGGWESGPRALK
ncbi:MAG TPA: efflux transporter outer membrane subunit [Steroidobacteraceae bacterium]|nr:efflux transporter outer membrane subunit [Steroidobacteraceae bacterium]